MGNAPCLLRPAGRFYLLTGFNLRTWVMVDNL